MSRKRKDNQGVSSMMAKPEPFDVALAVILTLLAVSIIIPFYSAIVMSFVSSVEATQRSLILWPHKFITDNYETILNFSSLFTGYKNTLFIVLVGVPLELLLTVMMGYCFSRDFIGKKVLFKLIIFTMFFGGGMVPTYILLRQLGLMNSHFATILLSACSTYYLIIIKGAFESMPPSLEEAAKLDGANDLTVLFRILLPLQAALLATFTLFFIVGLWNSWYWPMLTLQEPSKKVLPLMLREISSQSQQLADEMASHADEFDKNDVSNFGLGVKLAATVLTMLPIMVVYPFLQKYFVKGVMVGSIKM